MAQKLFAMGPKNAPEKIHALANKFLDLANLIMIHERLIDRLVIKVAEKAITVAEQAVSKYEDTKENESALKAARLVVTRTLEKLRGELVEKTD
jgi:F420-0:gamma-glutamyl ligase